MKRNQTKAASSKNQQTSKEGITMKPYNFHLSLTLAVGLALYLVFAGPVALAQSVFPSSGATTPGGQVQFQIQVDTVQFFAYQVGPWGQVLKYNRMACPSDGSHEGGAAHARGQAISGQLVQHR